MSIVEVVYVPQQDGIEEKFTKFVFVNMITLS